MKKLLKRSAWLLLLAPAVFLPGFKDAYFEISKNLEIFTGIYRELNSNYVDDIDPAKLMRSGIDAMLNTLDPYTTFYSEAETEEYRFQTTGKYGGIGSTIRKQGDYVIIAEPYKGFPADKVGLRPGDMILEIDGEPARGKSTDEVSRKLKGTPETEVTVLVKRPYLNKEIIVKIMREEIKLESVPYYGMVNDSIGYLRLTNFTQKCGREVRDAVEELKKNPGLRAVIFDLRGNTGGLLNEAVNVANVFVEKGQEVVSTRGRMQDSRKNYNTLESPALTGLPLVVLVNKESASASEIVAGAIQDLDRGVLVGQPTFGKGLVQTTRPLAYNTQLKITTAKYYIPSGRCIQAIDYSKKDGEASPHKIPDSLRSAFKTKSGRVVYDGAGIAPDVEVQPEELSNISVSLYTKNLIFDYATYYAGRHDSVPLPSKFMLTEKDYEDFVRFVADKEYDYSTKSEDILKQLEDNTRREKYYDAIQDDLKRLKEKMLHDKNNDLQKFKTEIMELVREEILLRYYYRQGQIEATFSTDPGILKAVELLSVPEEYRKLLHPKG